MNGNGKILITGADGFIGKALVKDLLNDRIPVKGVVRGRTPRAAALGLDDLTAVGDIGSEVNWRPVLKDVVTVVHLAARAHVMREHQRDPLADFRRVNTFGTLQLARAAAENGVKRLVFVSSIKVNGERTGKDTAFKPDDVPHPGDPYGLSKQEAEQGVWKVARDTGLEVVVVRPPLVYGPEVKGNFSKLLFWVARGKPLPFAAVNNRRSLISLQNLVDFLRQCICHPKAAGETFLVSDGHDLSTPGIIKLMALCLGRRSHLAGIPVPMLRILARVAGKTQMINRLCDSLVVDTSHARRKLGWKPRISVEKGFQETADWFHRGCLKG